MKELLLFIFCISFKLSAQVGIGTTTPEADLHVAGSTLIQDELKTKTLDATNTNDVDFKLITRLTNSNPVGEIARLDVDELTVAPINIVNYRFYNLVGDNVQDVDLSYEASRYLVAISNFRYIGDPIPKKAVPDHLPSIGTFITRAFTAPSLDGSEIDTWHLQIQNTFLDPNEGANIEYELTLVVYDKSYYRSLEPIEINLGGSNSGSTAAPNIK